MALPPSVDIVIVNWNSGDLLRCCLESISQARVAGFELKRVVVVDNASTDGSPERLDVFPLPLELIRNRENRGFAAACNQGARASDGDYLLFLNPDTRLSPESLKVPLQFLEEEAHANVGITGIQLVDDQGKTARSCSRFPTPGHMFAKMFGFDRLLPTLFQSHMMTEWDHGENRVVDHVIGAFFLVRTTVFRALGGFDERFFVYLEDLDFSLRARSAGWKSYYLAGAQAFHKGGGTSENIKGIRLFYSLRSRLLYAHKHFHAIAGIGVLLGTLMVEPFCRAIFLATNKSGRMKISEILTAYTKLVLWILETVFSKRLPLHE